MTHDPLYRDAVAIADRVRTLNAQTLQRRLKINFARARKLICELGRDGVISPRIGGEYWEVNSAEK